MGSLRRFLAWPLAEKWLLAKTWVLLFAVRLALWTAKYKRTRSLLARFHADPPKRLTDAPPAAVRVARIVHIASRFVPGGGHCLTRALTAQTLLIRRGYEVDVTIGVAKDEADQLLAHAWVRCGGEVLIGGDAELGRYTELQ